MDDLFPFIERKEKKGKGEEEEEAKNLKDEILSMALTKRMRTSAYARIQTLVH